MAERNFPVHTAPGIMNLSSLPEMSVVYAVLAPLLGLYVAALLMVYGRHTQLSRQARIVSWIALLVPVAGGLGRVFWVIARNIADPPEWDLLNFWIIARMGALGLNYYDPTHAATLALPHNPSSTFVELALNQPFLYPPPTILWFMPFGGLDLHTFTAWWYGAWMIGFCFSIWLLWKTFVQDGSPRGLLLVAALVFLLKGTYANANTGQTVCLVLLLLIQYYRCQSRFSGGLGLGLGMLVKPFPAILIAYSLLRKRWKPLVTVAVTVIAACIGTFALFGSQVFESYMPGSRFHGMPQAFYTELENQSLLAWILRLTGEAGPVNLKFLALAAVMAALTGWRIRKLGDQNNAWAFALALALILMLYPGSLKSYSVLLLIPILVLWSENRIAPVAVSYALMTMAYGNYTFLGTFTLWAALVFYSPRTEEHRPQTGMVLGNALRVP